MKNYVNHLDHRRQSGSQHLQKIPKMPNRTASFAGSNCICNG